MCHPQLRVGKEACGAPLSLAPVGETVERSNLREEDMAQGYSADQRCVLVHSRGSVFFRSFFLFRFKLRNRMHGILPRHFSFSAD